MLFLRFPPFLMACTYAVGAFLYANEAVPFLSAICAGRAQGSHPTGGAAFHSNAKGFLAAALAHPRLGGGGGPALNALNALRQIRCRPGSCAPPPKFTQVRKGRAPRRLVRLDDLTGAPKGIHMVVWFE